MGSAACLERRTHDKTKTHDPASALCVLVAPCEITQFEQRENNPCNPCNPCQKISAIGSQPNKTGISQPNNNSTVKKFESEYRLQTSKSLRRRGRLHELHGKDLILFKHSLNFLKPLPNNRITVSPGGQNEMFANVEKSLLTINLR